MSGFTQAGKPEGYERHHTVSELARLCGVSQRTVERWHALGRLPTPDYVTRSGWKLWSPDQVTEILRKLRAQRRIT